MEVETVIVVVTSVAIVAVVQTIATNRVARRQLMQVVVAHERRGPPMGGSGVRLHYYLKNEGLGPTMNIEHGSRWRAASLVRQ